MSSLEDLIEYVRSKETPEQKELRLAETRRRLDQLDKEMIERHRCSECGVDTLNYSHTFKCSWRGF